jgi:hypothetical protein
MLQAMGADIRVDGNRELSDAEVIAELNASGLSLGKVRSKLDTDSIQNRVMISSDKISWISVNIIGTVAQVEIRESEVVEEIPEPEPTYIPDKHAEYVVYDDETKKVSDGHEGHVVDVYLVTMDSKGLVISREKKYTDTYKPMTPKVYVGITPRETPVPAVYGW